MKKIYTLVLFVSTIFIGNAQIVNIPDANFKARLLEADYDNDIANGWLIDQDGDGEISLDEANDVESLVINYASINSLEGISSFSNLISLKCFSNNLTYIDLSQNVNLRSLVCSNNQLTILDVSQNLDLEFLDCSYNQLSTLDVSQNLVLRYLTCSYNQLSTLDVSQNLDLDFFSCHFNQLSTLDVSQNLGLRSFGCSNNQLSTLDVSQNLDLDFFSCHFNQLSTLDVSQNLVLRYLTCSNNQLSTLDISQNLDLETLDCSNNQLSTLDFSQNLQLIVLNCSGIPLSTIDISNHVLLYTLNCSNNQLSTLDVSQNLDLQILRCSNNQLSTLDFTQNPKLKELNCSNNELSTLFIKNNNQLSWSVLDFNDNPNLQYICADEADISLVQQQITSYAYTNCHVNSYCSFVPNGTFYTIQGNSKFDSNANGCDASDINMPNQKYTFTSGALNGSLIPDELGIYAYDVQSGTHVITPVLENPNYFIISPTSASVTFPAATSPFTQDFCVTANGIKNDVEVTVIPTNPARPGFDANYRIIYKNKGNQVANGTLNFSFDDTVMDLVSSFPSIYGSGTNSLTWNYTALNPFETREIDLVFNINSPTETPAVNLDDILNYTATIVGATDEETPEDNTMTLNQTVVNSFDPNDKTCLEGETITPSMVGEYVHYVIRFENTGTFPAENVVVTDVIDATKFDISTLIPQTSSHWFVTRINNGKVEFIFQGIYLFFDDANNDGYVAFKIKTKSNLVVGDEFTNTASIYFDYNFPIITNTTSTTVTALSNQDFDFETNFTLYPNPAKEVLNIKVKSEMEVKSVSIYNTLGQIIMTTIHAENGEINVSNLQSGSYFIKVFTEKGSSTTKFIKQ